MLWVLCGLVCLVCVLLWSRIFMLIVLFCMGLRCWYFCWLIVMRFIE